MRVLALANLYRPAHVEALAPYRPLNPAASSWNTALFDELQQLPGIELHVAQFPPVRHARVIEDGRTAYHYLPRIPQVDGFTSVFKRARVAALIRRLKPDVVHGIGSEHGYAWPVVGQGVPSVVTIHGYMRVINELAGHSSRLRRWFLVPEERRALLRADRVIAVNDYMRQSFVSDGCPAERVRVVPNALNPTFLAGSATDVEPRRIDLVMVGTIQPLKNHHVALQILKLLRDEHGLRPRVLIVGAPTVQSRDYHGKLLRQCAEAGLDTVEFIGKKPASELAAIYRSSRYLFHLSEFETDSMVVAEALACGAVPVVNPVAALAHRVQDGRNGHHVAAGDVRAAARRLAAILGTDDTRALMAEDGRRAAVEERIPRQVALKTFGVYEALCAQPGTQGRLIEERPWVS